MNTKLTRRQFIHRTAVGTAATCFLPWLGTGSGNAIADEKRSRVVTVSHSRIIDDSGTISEKITRQAVDDILVLLMKTSTVKDAWMALFPKLNSSDIIGIKVNTINHALPSHPEVVYAIAASLIDSLAMNPNNIIIWDREDFELEHSHFKLNATGKGIRCFGTDTELFNDTPKREIGFDDRMSFDVGIQEKIELTRLLTEICDYLINVPVLKDHYLSGVTLSMKNHYGSFDMAQLCHANGCDPYIAKLNAIPYIKDKTQLIICDALMGMYDGGPTGPPQWINRQLIASQDPVAHDYTGTLIIDKKRIENELSPIIGEAVHIKTASKIGLGNADPKRIESIRENLG